MSSIPSNAGELLLSPVSLDSIDGTSGAKSVERQYEELLNEYGPGLARLVSCYESLPQAREDLLQEIRLALWVALLKFRGECSWKTFVYRIAHNRSLTHTWRRRKLPQQFAEVPDIADSRADPEATAIRSADHSSLMKAVRTLPLPYRQVITLMLEDLSQSEIAAVIGISEGSVAVRLNRARKMLRNKLEAPND